MKSKAFVIAAMGLLLSGVFVVGLWLLQSSSKGGPPRVDGEADRARAGADPGAPAARATPLAGSGVALNHQLVEGARRPDAALDPAAGDLGPPSHENVAPARQPGLRAFDGDEDAGPEEMEFDHIRYATDAAGIEAALQRHLPKLRACYENSRQELKKEEGTLTLEFAIAMPPTGEAAHERPADAGWVRHAVLMHSKMGNLGLEGCALNVIQRLQFDLPDVDLNITYQIP